MVIVSFFSVCKVWLRFSTYLLNLAAWYYCVSILNILSFNYYCNFVCAIILCRDLGWLFGQSDLWISRSICQAICGAVATVFDWLLQLITVWYCITKLILLLTLYLIHLCCYQMYSMWGNYTSTCLECDTCAFQKLHQTCDLFGVNF